jgi:hypothetical protein
MPQLTAMHTEAQEDEEEGVLALDFLRLGELAFEEWKKPDDELAFQFL